MADRRHDHVASSNRQYAVGLSRAVAGATIFSLPLLMTMEMWWLGFSLHPGRLMVFSLGHILVLYGLSHVAGFEASQNRLDDLLDAFAAYGVGTVTATVALVLFGVIEAHNPVPEIAGKIAIQAVPASFGAMIGAKLLGEGDDIEEEERGPRESFGGRMFLALAGAMFLSLTVAPTEEMQLIAFQMTPVTAMLLVLLSLLALHAIVHWVGFPGQERRRGSGHAIDAVRGTLPAYAVSVLASFYVLWCFGSLDGANSTFIARSVAVLGVPAAIGAGIARIVV